MQAETILREVCFNPQAPALMGLVGRKGTAGAITEFGLVNSVSSIKGVHYLAICLCPSGQPVCSQNIPHFKYLWVRPRIFDDLENPMRAKTILREVCFNPQAPALMGSVSRKGTLGAIAEFGLVSSVSSIKGVHHLSVCLCPIGATRL